MRLRRLELIAFGPFTDRVVEFGEPAACDLHVVLGPNEAGKSSSSRAIHALLFGFPHRTRDAHVHPNDRLRVGALLDGRDGSSVELARVKARVRDLRDAADEPIADDGLREMLGGIDEALYTRLFLVDHDELRKGGEALLAGGGEFGVSVFGATLGGGDLPALQRSLATLGDELFKPAARARNPLLNAALNEYRERVDAARERSVRPHDHEAATLRVDELADRRIELTRRVEGLEAEVRMLMRLTAVAGMLTRRRAVVAELQRLGDVPILASDAGSQRERAIRDRARARDQIATEQRRLGELRPQIDGTVVADGLLDRASEVEDLREQAAVHDKALLDREKRVRELGMRRGEAARLREQLGALAEGPAARVDEGVRTAIEALGDEQATLRERVRVAEERLARAQTARDRAAASLEVHPQAPELPDAIRSWSSALTDVQPEVIAARRQREIALGELRSLEASAGRVSPPFDPGRPGGVDPPPASAIGRCKADLADLDARIVEVDATHERLSAERAQHVTALGNLGTEGIEGAHGAMHSSRDERDRTFTRLGDRLLDEDLDGARHEHGRLADGIARADRLADDLLAAADRVAQRDRLVAEIAECDRVLSGCASSRAGLVTRRDQLLTGWRRLWAPCGIEPLDDPAAMAEWRERYERDVARHGELRVAIAAYDAVIDDGEAKARKLRAALGEAGFAPEDELPQGQLLERARAVLERIDEAAEQHRNRAAELASADDELLAARGGLDEARDQLEHWRLRWKEALGPLSLSVDTSPAEARTAVVGLADLAAREVAAVDLQGRIDAIDADYQAFAKAVGALVERVADDLRGGEARDAIRLLGRRLADAREAHRARERLLEKATEAQERIEGHEAEVREADEVLARLCRRAGCDEVDALEEVERRASTRDRLNEELADLERRILEFGEESPQRLEEMIGGRSGDRLAADRAGRESDLATAKAELEQLVEEHTEAVAHLRGLDRGTDAALELEAAQRKAADIEELGERYLSARAAGILLNRAVQHHRENSAQPILRRAEQFLPQLTAGSLSGLAAVDGEGDQPVLVARRTDGADLHVDQMSTGTRDQLYLALRLAALEHHLDALPPLPVLLDGILVNYDVGRVASAMHALAEVARRTQVIVLTHHQHVAQIAERTLGDDVRVHHLDRAGSG